MAIRLSLRRLSRGLRLLSKCAPRAEIAPGSPASPIGLLTGIASPRHRSAQAALRFSLGPAQLSSSAGPFLPCALPANGQESENEPAIMARFFMKIVVLRTARGCFR